MSLYAGSAPAVLCRGGGAPAALYRGERCIAGWREEEKSLPALWRGTYRDAFRVRARGRGWQQTYSGKNLLAPFASKGSATAVTAEGGVYRIQVENRSWNGVFSSECLALPVGTEITAACRVDQMQAPYCNFGLRERDDPEDFSGTLSLTRPITAPGFYSYTYVTKKPYLKFYFYVTNGTTVLTNQVTAGDFQVEAGAAFTGYEPYVGASPSPSPAYPQALRAGSCTLRAVGKERTAVLSLPVLRGLPGSGVCDSLESLGGGRWRCTRRVGVISGYSGQAVGEDFASSTGDLTEGAEVWYALPAPREETLELGTLPTWPGETALSLEGADLPEVLASAKTAKGGWGNA